MNEKASFDEYMSQIQQIRKDQMDYGAGSFGSIAKAVKDAYPKTLEDMVKQESPFAKAMKSMESSEPAIVAIGQCEFIIVGVPRNPRPVETMFCTDAKDMQTRVALMKENPEWVGVFIFKRMLGYKARVEWEAVEADV